MNCEYTHRKRAAESCRAQAEFVVTGTALTSVDPPETKRIRHKSCTRHIGRTIQQQKRLGSELELMTWTVDPVEFHE